MIRFLLRKIIPYWVKERFRDFVCDVLSSCGIRTMQDVNVNESLYILLEQKVASQEALFMAKINALEEKYIQHEHERMNRSDLVAMNLDQKYASLEALFMAKVNSLEEKYITHEQEQLNRSDLVLMNLDQKYSCLESMFLAKLASVEKKRDELEEKRIEQIKTDLEKHNENYAKESKTRITDFANEIDKIKWEFESSKKEFISNIARFKEEDFSQGELRNIYSEFLQRDQTSQPLPLELHELYSALIKKWMPSTCPYVTVLDIGCGYGTLLTVLTEHSKKAIGVDSNLKIVETCLQKGLRVENADALKFLQEQPDCSMDVITCMHVVEHLSIGYTLKLFKEAHRVLIDNGLLIIDTPKISSLYTLLHYYYQDPTHKQPRHHELYKFLLTNVGFNSIQLEDIIRENNAPPVHLTPASDENQVNSQRMTENMMKMCDHLQDVHNLLLIARDIRFVCKKGN